MKTITLLPAKNEAWILEATLQNFSSFSDYIIIADQQSRDGSDKIYSRFPKVRVIENAEMGHTNKIRWRLLDEARKIPGNNLIFCLDADEMISSENAQRIKELMTKEEPGLVISLPWIQLWGSFNRYRIDGVWKNNWKEVIFYDDRVMDYEKSLVINDHTRRVPRARTTQALNFPLIHFQFLAWERTSLKQAWYRMQELIARKEAAKKINLKYSITLETPSVLTKEVPKEWIGSLPLPPAIDLGDQDPDRLQDIFQLFDQYGIQFFEPLQIWHIEKLEKEFIKRVGRKPKSKTFSSLIINLNNLKNHFLH